MPCFAKIRENKRLFNALSTFQNYMHFSLQSTKLPICILEPINNPGVTTQPTQDGTLMIHLLNTTVLVTVSFTYRPDRTRAFVARWAEKSPLLWRNQVRKNAHKWKKSSNVKAQTADSDMPGSGAFNTSSPTESWTSTSTLQ